MKFIGGVTTSLAVAGASSGSASAAEYRTITVGENEQRLIEVGSGETLENVLIDISASGADARVEASGDDWTVRNVGFRGRCDVDKGSGFWNRLNVSGNGVVDRVYLGDGAVSGKNIGGSGCPSSHSGHIEFKRSYVAEWTDNGLYTAHTAENGQGTFYIHDCYFRDNNVAHLRIASDGTLAERCVIHNTGNVPYDDVVDSKGIYTGYGDPEQVVEIRDCQVDMSDTNGEEDAYNSNDDWHPEMSTVEVYDNEYIGSIHGPYVGLVSGNGNNPIIQIPDGVPTSAEDAASGDTSTSDGAPSCSIVSPTDGATVSDTLTIKVDAEDAEDSAGTLDVEVSVDAGDYRAAAYDSADGLYHYDIDTTTLTEGEHTLDARATDSNGSTTDASQLTVTVESSDTSVAVSTVDASVVDSTTVVVDGSLSDLGGADSADVYFDYRVTGTNEWTSTATETLSTTTAYTRELSSLQSGSEYEFRGAAVASDGDSDTGSLQTFSTGTGDEPTEPTVEYYKVGEAGSPNPHAEITVNWGVADSGGDLDSVLVEVTDASDAVIDAARSSISGADANDTDYFKIKHAQGQTFEVTLTVTDQAGNVASTSSSVSER